MLFFFKLVIIFFSCRRATSQKNDLLGQNVFLVFFCSKIISEFSIIKKLTKKKKRMKKKKTLLNLLLHYISLRRTGVGIGVVRLGSLFFYLYTYAIYLFTYVIIKVFFKGINFMFIPPNFFLWLEQFCEKINSWIDWLYEKNKWALGTSLGLTILARLFCPHPQVDFLGTFFGTYILAAIFKKIIDYLKKCEEEDDDDDNENHHSLFILFSPINEVEQMITSYTFALFVATVLLIGVIVKYVLMAKSRQPEFGSDPALETYTIVAKILLLFIWNFGTLFLCVLFPQKIWTNVTISIIILIGGFFLTKEYHPMNKQLLLLKNTPEMTSIIMLLILGFFVLVISLLMIFVIPLGVESGVTWSFLFLKLIFKKEAGLIGFVFFFFFLYIQIPSEDYPFKWIRTAHEWFILISLLPIAVEVMFIFIELAFQFLSGDFRWLTLEQLNLLKELIKLFSTIYFFFLLYHFLGYRVLRKVIPDFLLDTLNLYLIDQTTTQTIIVLIFEGIVTWLISTIINYAFILGFLRHDVLVRFFTEEPIPEHCLYYFYGFFGVFNFFVLIFELNQVFRRIRLLQKLVPDSGKRFHYFIFSNKNLIYHDWFKLTDAQVIQKLKQDFPNNNDKSEK